MTDKEIIKAEIEKEINNIRKYIYHPSLAGHAKREMTAVEQALKNLLQFIDSLPEKLTSEDLEEEITKCYKSRNDLMMTRNQFGELIHRFTEWQKQKDQETIELAEDHAMLAGMNKMKEEMMENAVDAFVHQGLYSKYVTECDDEALANVLKNYNSGDKVKLIIIKEDKQ